MSRQISEMNREDEGLHFFTRFIAQTFQSNYFMQCLTVLLSQQCIV
jgi:hypothetical protein